MSSNRVANLVPVWSPMDAVDTAEAFAAEIAHAERGQAVVVEAGPYRAPRLAVVPDRGNWLLSRSRERRARAMDFLAVSLLMALMACFGVIVYILTVTR